MDDSDQYYTFDSKLGAYFSRRTITIATLFLATTLIAMTLGWVKLLANASGNVVFLIVLSTTTLLAVVVGYRLSAANIARLRASLLFACGSIIVASYSAFIANVIQKPANTENAWGGFDHLISALSIVAGLPIVGVVVVFMLRSWCWSAHDRIIPKESLKVKSQSIA